MMQGVAQESEEKSISCHFSDPPNELVTFTVIGPKVMGTTNNAFTKIKKLTEPQKYLAHSICSERGAQEFVLIINSGYFRAGL